MQPPEFDHDQPTACHPRSCLAPGLAACHWQSWICRRLKAAIFESSSNIWPAHSRLGTGEDPCRQVCAGHDPLLALIGRCCWPRCQQIHAIREMIHDRADGKHRSQMIFIPGVHYILKPGSVARALSSGVCSTREGNHLLSDSRPT